MNAVDAAVAVAEAHGVRCEKPIVLREAWHVLVHLWPAPVVARVTSGAPGVNPDDVEQELHVARHAARAGAPVVQPSEAGRGLRTLHDSLADYDGELPRAGRADEVRAMLEPFAPSDDVELLCELASRELPEGQALHGDVHLFNCIQTRAGPIWHDLETACRGPREYDLAALMLSDRSGESDPEARLALAAYGDYGEELLDSAIPVYAAWVAASFMVALARRPTATTELERQLQFLRRFRR
jgi:Ser/Thr protein kinase RdoA (MazF antagonist)